MVKPTTATLIKEALVHHQGAPYHNTKYISLIKIAVRGAAPGAHVRLHTLRHK